VLVFAKSQAVPKLKRLFES